MIKSIEIGKNYAIRLSKLYGSTKYNVNIIGSTTIDNVTKNQDSYNIYETFFKPMGLGLTTYYTAISETTTIYICASITNLTPLQIDTKEKIFIPSTLIDMNISDEFVPAMNINFNIYPLLRELIPDEEERVKYLDKLLAKIKDRLGTLVEFNDRNITIEPVYDIIYMEKESLKKIESDRDIEYNAFINRQNDIKNLNDYKENLFNSKYNDMNVSKMLYDREYDNLRTDREKLHRLIEHYERLIEDAEHKD